MSADAAMGDVSRDATDATITAVKNAAHIAEYTVTRAATYAATDADTWNATNSATRDAIYLVSESSAP